MGFLPFSSGQLFGFFKEYEPPALLSSIPQGLDSCLPFQAP